MGGRMGVRPGIGSIIGNKNTKVYHLAGDKGNMPAEKNRAYFRTEREAIAAGYHRAGMRVVKHHPVIHPRGSMMHTMPSGSMNGRLPK
jgi:methylphosphotriester-DNA--protein-cysteine methyltransferase